MRSPKLDGLSDEQIRHFFKDEPHFGGVYANDEMPKPQPGKCYIMNLQNSDEGGSHWVALCDSYYFDSYGEMPTKRIAKYVTHYDSSDYQGLNATSCGYFAIYACCNFLAGRHPAYGLIPDETRHNENVLKKFFYSPLAKGSSLA